MTRNYRRRITALTGHIEICAALINTAEHEIAEQEESAAWGTRTVSATRSTISSRFVGDPTGTRALTHDNTQSTQARRDLNNAITQAEHAINHLRHTLTRQAGHATTDTTKEQRCPQILLIHDGAINPQTGLPDEHASHYLQRPCGALTASTPRPDGTGYAWRIDGLCLDHGTEADQAERRAHDSNTRRLRRHAS